MLFDDSHINVNLEYGYIAYLLGIGIPHYYSFNKVLLESTFEKSLLCLAKFFLTLTGVPGFSSF